MRGRVQRVAGDGEMLVFYGEECKEGGGMVEKAGVRELWPKMKVFEDGNWGEGWKTTGLDVQYKMDSGENGDILRIWFAPSNSKLDWKLNFDFAVVPYRDMKNKWKAHRGFVRAWKSAREEIVSEVGRHKFRVVEVYGYSLGGALAQLAMEDLIWRGIGDKVYGKVWGSPRVFAKVIKMDRLEKVEAWTDLVTKCPPLGFTGRVGMVRKVGKRGMARCKGHEPVNYVGT